MLALLLALGLPAGMAAEGLPALHDVTGVATDDVLHIRARPDASAPVLGALASDATGVEVVGTDQTGRWGQVNLAGETGWAALHYLARQPGQEEGTFPPVASCFGTEPFWTLRLKDGAATWVEPGREIAGRIVARLASSSPRDRYGLVAEMEGTRLSGVIAPRACSDGMSDRAWGLAFDALYGDAVLSGCCSLGR